jgi:hypothetical protein
MMVDIAEIKFLMSCTKPTQLDVFLSSQSKSKKLVNLQKIDIKHFIDRPSIEFDTYESNLYTMLMVKNEESTHYVYWMVINCAIKQGKKTVFEYKKPSVKGEYVIYLFEHSKDILLYPLERFNFNIDDFMTNNSLGKAAATLVIYLV